MTLRSADVGNSDALRVNGTGFALMFKAAGATTKKTANYTTAGETVHFLDPSGGAFTVTIGADDIAAGRVMFFINTTTSTNAVTIKTSSGNINGTAGSTGITGPNATREWIVVASDGTDCYAAQLPIPS